MVKRKGIIRKKIKCLNAKTLTLIKNVTKSINEEIRLRKNK